MAHHQHADRLTIAHLHGAASRHAGWEPSQGPAREAAIAELRAIATETPPRRRRSLHQPAGVLRADLLAEAAGTLLGAAADGITGDQDRIAAQLLIDAGADEGKVREWARVGWERRAGGEGAPFSGPYPPGAPRAHR